MPDVSNTQGIQQAPQSSPIVPTSSPNKGGVKPNIIALCAVLLQESVNAHAKNLAEDEKDMATKGAELKNLDNRMRDMGHWKLILTTVVTWTTEVTHNTPDMFQKWGYTVHNKHSTLKNQATAMNCKQEIKQRSAERDQISNSFGQVQTACQAPETGMNTETNSIQQSEEQGLNLLIKLQQLTFAALGKQQS